MDIVLDKEEIVASGAERGIPVMAGIKAEEIENEPSKSLGLVLVVDDEIDIAFLLKKRLENAGYEVLTANDGLSATKMIVHRSPDVVILDIGMPAGDGHTVASRIRNNANTALTPIIFLTARTMDKDRTRAANSGAFAYVTKPFDAQELLDLVKQANSYWR